MNFATLKGLTIPEGVVTQIADASGRVLWKLETSKPVVLEVEKITADTYAGETTYTGEQFILLDIYPKTNGTVKVTYGGLTKTITDTSGAEEPNAQKVFFGTFNGVSDSVATPASGELTIEGGYTAFANGSYEWYNSTISKAQSKYCLCTTAIIDFGGVEIIPSRAFYNDTNEATTKTVSIEKIPDSVKNIGGNAFCNWTSLKFGDNFFTDGLVSIGDKAFSINGMSSSEDIAQSLVVTIPATVVEIGEGAFGGAIYDGASNYSYFSRVTMLPTTPPNYPDSNTTIFGKKYTSAKDFTIIVPKGCSGAYKAAAGWSVYANYIVEAS